MIEIGAKPKSLKEPQGQYLGLLKFTPEGWGRVEHLLQSLPSETRDRIDMTALLQRLLQNGAEIQTVPVKGKWCEVDSLEDKTIYERRINEGDWSHDWRWD